MSPPTAQSGKRKRRWLRWTAAAVVFLLLADLGLLWVFRKAPVRRFLIARLEATFGRRVEVRDFDLSLLGRPRLQANYITVAEDPRFGNEYFLLAERLSAGLRWRSLLRGRFEFGTLALSRPSFNLVRNAAGEWNLASWLPAPVEASPAAPPAPPAASESAGPAGLAPPGRIYRIEVDGGRLNIKRGPDKLPFAIVNVSGSLDQETVGRWRVDLEGELRRTTVELQEAGTLRIRGRVGSTRARLRPADLDITWEEASLADVLRLVQGRDSGVRGDFSLDLKARVGEAAPAAPGTPSPSAFSWSLAGTARLRGVHRWDLPPRSGDPALNLIVEAQWWPEESRVELTRGEIEAPGSSIHATGLFDWSRAAPPHAPRSLPRRPPAGNEQFRLRLTSAGIALGDVFAWYRAFRPGVSDAATLAGNAGLDFLIAGWPPAIERGTLAAEGTEFRLPGLSAPLTASRVLLRYERNALVLVPVTLAQEQANEAAPASPRTPQPRTLEPLRLEGRITPDRDALDLSLTGAVPRVQEAMTLISALGAAPLPGWTVDGAAALRLRWQGTVIPFAARASGTVDLIRVGLRSPLLSQPVLLSQARLALDTEKRQLDVRSAQAFGARWSGSLVSANPDGTWEFDLSADRLDVADVARAFTPPARGLLARIGPSPRRAAFALPVVEGRLTVDRLILPPLELRRVRGVARLDGGIPWSVRLTGGQADFYGGRLSGSFRAEGGDEPSYQFEGSVERVNLAALTSATTALRRRFAGAASGEFRLTTRGIGRQALLASLEGSGTLRVQPAAWRGANLLAWLENPQATPPPRAASSTFASASGEFSLNSRTVQLEKLRLVAAPGEWEAAGTVDFAQALSVFVRPVSPRATDPTGGRALRVTGSLREPQFEWVTPPPPSPRE